MRIISNFKDFYDSALAMGVDKTIVYKRFKTEPEAIDLGKFESEIFTEDERQTLYDAEYVMGNNEIVYVIVAGYIYPIIVADIFVGTGLLRQSKRIFCPTEKHLKSFKNVRERLAKDSPKQYFRAQYTAQQKEKVVKDFYALSGKDITQYAGDNQTVTAVIGKRRYVEEDPQFPPETTESRTNVIIHNPRLKYFKIQKLLDPFTAMQNIMMWVSGVLGSPAGDIIQISDKDLVQAKGFDVTYGFRTRPKK